MIGKEMIILQGNVLLEQVARRQGVTWVNLSCVCRQRL